MGEWLACKEKIFSQCRVENEVWSNFRMEMKDWRSKTVTFVGDCQYPLSICERGLQEHMAHYYSVSSSLKLGLEGSAVNQ